MSNAQIYFNTDIFHAAIDRLEVIARTFDPHAPDILRTEIIEALGEVMSIWPIEIFAGDDEGRVIVAA